MRSLCRARALSVLLLLASPAAMASGSWAVPRFTPTWAELQRDLKALGFKSTPVAQKRPKPKPKPKVVTPTTGVAEAEGQKTTPTETAVAEKKETQTPADTEGEKAVTGTTTGDQAGTGTVANTPAGQVCYCQPMPQPTCPDVVTTPPREDKPAVNEETVAPVETAPKEDATGIAAPKKKTGATKKKKQPSEKTGRPKADDESDTGKLKQKKYWWQDQ